MMKTTSSPYLFIVLGVALTLGQSLLAQEPVKLVPSQALITTNAQFQPSTNSIPPQGAVILFNGRDLTGWKACFTNADLDISKLWSASDKVLHLAGKPYGYLCTEKKYSNYHLHVEWRWQTTNGNSGVFVHAEPDKNTLWPRSVECQLKSGNAGELLGLNGITFDAPLVGGRSRLTVKESSEKSIGEWNSYDIYCQGSSVETWVNGVKKNHAEKAAVDTGAIALQFEGRPIEFRNVWLNSL